MNYIYDIIAIRLDTKNKLLSYQRLPMYPSSLSYTRSSSLWVLLTKTLRDELRDSLPFILRFAPINGGSLRTRPRPSRTLHACIYNKRDTPFGVSLSFNQRLPILPGRHQPSTFGVYELNYCVRDGNRWTLVAIATESVRVCTLKTT